MISSLNSASLKSRIIKLKNKLIFVDNSQEEEFFQNPYLIIILISKNPIAVFNSAQWNQCLDHPEATIFIQKATQKDLSWLLDASIIGYKQTEVLLLHIT